MKINELKRRIDKNTTKRIDAGNEKKKDYGLLSFCKYMKRDSVYLPIHETCSFVSGVPKGVSSEVSSKSAGDIQPDQNKFLIEIIIIGLR